ncbi:MAG: hypothetical protein JW787_00500 [Sedimentisphaerales bacterium]|nr:hypothetical protein [Sedimentisphaerales bacterium]
MNSSKSESKNRKQKHICLMLILILFLTLSISINGCSRKKTSETYDVKILVLDNCGGDNNTETPPSGDEVLMLDSKGNILKKISGFQVKDSYHANRAISVSEDGRFFAVCEEAANKLSIYETSTGLEYWSAVWPEKSVHSAIFFGNTLYAVNQTTVMALDLNKKSINEINRFWEGVWLDFAFDKKNDCLWAVGLNVRKYSMDFKRLLMIGSILGDKSVAGVFSVDIASDGSVWAAAGDVVQMDGLENQLLKISPDDGNIVKTIKLDICPSCIRVDKSDDSVWITGIKSDKDYKKIVEEWPETLTELDEVIETDVITYTHKYNSNGDRIIESEKGGYSLVIDPSDKSAWIAGHDSIIHFSNTGDIIDEYKNVSKRQKWIALVK